jgi:K+-sensing histidine kinase KdpD
VSGIRDRSWARRQAVASLASLGAVALVSLAIVLLEPVAPTLSLGVLYLFAVLPVAVLFGLAYAIPVSIVSMLAFNWLFLPPEHTLALADSENWVALTVYVVTAVSVSALATQARRRAEESERRKEEAMHAARRAAETEARREREALEAEALRRSDAAKTAVLRSVSHDLRSPITAIMTASDVLAGSKEQLSTGDRDELVAAVGLQAARLHRLVSNLLELSRLEAGAADPELELWTADGLVARALEVVGPRNDLVDVAVPDDLPLVRVDPTQIERALANLIENALKASSDIGRVEVRADSVGADVLLRVTDRGPGIPAHEHERIFEPFVRGAADARQQGSGLGLAIARGFAASNGGRLWVESTVGVGATFTLALPAVTEPVKLPA